MPTAIQVDRAIMPTKMTAANTDGHDISQCAGAVFVAARASPGVTATAIPALVLFWTADCTRSRGWTSGSVRQTASRTRTKGYRTAGDSSRWKDVRLYPSS